MAEQNQAPDGAIWVCAACGRSSLNRHDIGDESCYMHAVLCKKDSLQLVDGLVRKADAYKPPELTDAKFPVAVDIT